uniref:non-ribosomal peptide synthetase n=1 Tax=Herbidospora sakaeratensis TaxID=564415 RepID=UPI000780640A|nr:non-ribosomal peptide synthetase [Herbidospora sakaeratensis]
MDAAATFPLSPGQRRMWFLDQLAPGATHYVEIVAVPLGGHVDAGALGAALGELVVRHEILRTRYADDGSGPVQIVDPPAPVPLAVTRAPREEVADAEAATPIDLTTGPILRAVLAVGEEEDTLVLAVHHIAVDGWSLDVLCRELREAYTAFAAGRVPRLPEPALQYADYALWQESLRHDGDLAYWAQTLAGAAPAELPGDRPRPQTQQGEGAIHPFRVPAALAAALRDLGTAERASLFSTLYAAFAMTLARHTRVTDVVVGTPVAGRPVPEVEDLVGYFVNSVALRADLGGDPSFREAVRRAREVALDAFAHAGAPFDLVVDHLGVERDLSRNPVFQIAFVLQNTPQDHWRRLPPRRQAALFDLTFELTETPDGGLDGLLTYAEALYDHPTAARLAARYVAVLEQVAADPDLRLGALDPLTAGEHDALAGWNRTEAPGPWPPLHRLVERHAAATPGAIAVEFGGTTLTYAELDARATALAARLDVPAESPVAVCLRRGPSGVIAFLAALKAGAAYLPLDPAHPDERLHATLDDAGAPLLVTEPALAARFPGRPIVLAGDEGGSADLERTDDPDRLAYVIYTSGSTGRPKGVAVPHRGLAGVAAHQAGLLGLTAADRVLQFGSPSFDASVYEIVMALAHGATLCLADADDLLPGDALAATLERLEVTAALIPPSCLAATPPRELPRLRVLTVGGEACPEAVVRDWSAPGRRLVNLYGPTEITILASAVDCDPADGVPPIGRPIPGMRLHILDDALNPMPVGARGELFLGGDGVARGYAGRPGLTAGRFVPDPWGPPGSRLYRSGDEARWLPDGRIEFLGRLDHQVKIRGHRVELGEIRAALARHPDVGAAVVVPHGDRIAAYVTGAAEPAALRAFLRRGLPEYMIPAQLQVLDRFPLTTSGKIDLAALPAPAVSSVSSGSAPRTPDEARIAAIWAAALGSAVGVDDVFFDAGGDSIRAVAVVGEMRRAGYRVSVRDVFTHRTVAALTEAVTGRAPASGQEGAAPFALLEPGDRARLPAGLDDAYPASANQVGMLYEQLKGGEADYHTITSFLVRGAFDADGLRARAAAAHARHDVLRTSFDLTSFGEPMQLVHHDAGPCVDVDDLRHLTGPEADRAVRAFLDRWRRTPLDVTRAPLLRITAHLLPGDAWRLTLVQCHAVLDGWSQHLLVGELLGREPGPIPIRYADFVRAERRRPAESAYWDAVLAAADPLTVPAAWGGTGTGHYTLPVHTGDLDAGLRALAALAGAPMKAVLHTAYLKALGVLTGRDTVWSGLVSHGRPEEPGGDRVLGLFVNSVPFGARLTGTWTDVVRRVFAGHLDLEPHRAHPLAELQRRHPSAGRLVDAVFNYVDFATSADERLDHTATYDVTQSELAFDVSTTPDGLLLTAREDRLARPYGELLTATLRGVLAAMAADPDADAGRHRLAWPAAQAAPPAADDCLHTLFERQAARTPDALAVDAPDARLTYAQLNAAADALAATLPGDGRPVPVCLPHGAGLVTTLLAVLKSGAPYLPLDPDLPEERRRALVAATAGHRPGEGPGSVAYLIHTSGSTGRPKGVAVTHRGVANRVADTIRRHRVTPADRVLLRTPIGFDAAAWEIFVPLLAGAAVVVGEGDTAWDARAVVTAVAERGVTVLQAVPSMLRLLADEGAAGLRLVYSAGEQLDRATAERVAAGLPGAELWNAYGPTECSIGCLEGRHLAGDPGEAVPIGTPIAGVDVLVAGPGGGPVADGAVGELYVGGIAVAQGYHGDPARTAAAFVPDPRGGGGRLYRTGDLVRRLPDGRYAFCGRTDAQLKVRGVRIEPGEVEAALLRHPEVAAAAVTARDNRLIGYVAGTAAPADLRAFLRRSLPAEYVPTDFATLPELPLTPNGKIDRAALPEVGRTVSRVAPRTPEERLVRDVWSDVLGVGDIGADDDFFQLGGYSLLVPRLAAALRGRSGAPIPLRDLFAASTVEAQARLLTSRDPAPAPVARDRSVPPPLSPGQRRLWFLDRLEPGSPEYVLPIVLRPQGTPEAMAAALRALADRHEILRTRYDDTPAQIVDPHPTVDFTVSADDLGTVLARELATGFDLAAGPVWRATLAADGRLLLLVHHIACDGHSAGIIRRDLDDLLAGRPLAPLPFRYADVAAAHDEGDLGYWRARLAGLPTMDLPADRPSRRTPGGATLGFDVPAGVAGAALATGRELGATPYMTTLAAFAVLLSHVCATTDVVVGTPVAGRLSPESAGVVGFFVNTLVLRCDLADVTGLAGAIPRARETALGAFAHQGLPFERLVEELAPDRDLGRTPLFQVMFEMGEEVPGDDEVLGAWTRAKFDLTLNVARRPDGSLRAVFEYATDLFTPEAIARLAGAYTRILAGEPIVTETPAPPDDVPEGGVLPEMVEEQVRRTPDAVAVEFGAESLTYAELDARANALAHRLRALGVGPDVPVGVLLDRSFELVVGLLGVLKAGGCYVPLETEYPPARIGRLLGEAGARLCLTAPGTPLPAGVRAVTVDDATAAAGPASTTRPDHLVAVYYTSGSTGRPKGVAATHRGWAVRIAAMQEAIGLRPGQGVLQKTTVVFDDLPVEVFWPLVTGGRVVLLAPGAHRDPAAILRAAADHDVAVVLVVPSMLAMLTELAPPAGLRHVGTSGEALRPELAMAFLDRFPGVTLHNHWGVTEASIDSTRHRVSRADAGEPGAVPIGRPLPGARVHVLDADLRPVLPGTRGELYIGGPGVARGYHGDPARTAAAFVPDPFTPGGRLYRTGDLARRREDGTIVFLGRTDHQVKIRGVRVEPGEIESVLRGCPGVLDAVVDVWRPPSGDLRLAGYFQAAGGTTGADVRRHLEDRLPGYLVPSALIPLPAVPRTAAGKTDRAALPPPDPAAALREQGVTPPRTAAEEIIAGIWSEALGAEVGVHNDFFHAGGHSLLAAQVIAAVQDRFDLEVSLRTLFERPTVAQLAAAVEDLIRAEVAGLSDAEVRAETTPQETRA